ncbi:MAG TPA: trypsin-like peptidase domain-containing protein [Candidatus Deferrimicrobium sp.]|nr:trypsin-like peptidase domain-containing protein [Candidatus Deferrimicrobium sp.]
MRLKSLFVTGCFSIIIIPATVSAQVSSGGTPVSFARMSRSAIPAVTMPPVDVAALLAEDSIEQDKSVPFRFGYPFDVHFDLNNSGAWEALEDGGRLWRLRIECPGAYSINLVYDRFRLPEGARLYVYNADKSYVIGAFTSQNNKPHGEFSTGLVIGDVSIIEYYEPANVDSTGMVSIRRIIHAYKNLFDFGHSGSCNNNVNCPEGAPWQSEKRAVAMILTQGGFRLCSGVMVNNVRQDLLPYFLTANHCLGGEETWVFMFNYESPSCLNVNGPTWMTVSGSTRKANSSYSDFALLLLDEQPPDSYNVYYSGWAADDLPSDTSVGIHHPQGDIKKVSFNYDATQSTGYLGVPGSGNTHWRVDDWEDGTTEPGSSGSPLFNTEHRIVGQLHGGYASCSSITSDWYGKFSKSWNYGSTASTRLKDWLDPDNTGTLLLEGSDAGPVSINHAPLGDVKDTVNDYEVLCTITSGAVLMPESLLLFYEVDSIWYQDALQPTGGPDEYRGFISPQVPGTVINYYMYARNISGVTATTDTFSFRVIDYAVSVLPVGDSQIRPSEDSVDYMLTVYNQGVYADNYNLTDSAATWSTGFFDETGLVPITATGDVAADDSVKIRVRVAVPVGAVENDADTAVVFIVSQHNSAVLGGATLITVSSGPLYYCGDVDGDRLGPNVADLTYLVSYLFAAGPPPPFFEAADVDGSTGVPNVSDLTYLVYYMFTLGPPPICL